VSASAAGGAFHPEDRAAHAVDGDATTAWRIGGRPEGATLTIRPDGPRQADEVRILQQQEAEQGRRILEVTVQVDGGPAAPVALDERSLTGDGQVVPLADDEVGELVITITRVAPPADAPVGDRVGIAEVDLAGLVVEEQVRPPVDLLGRAGAAAASNPLDIVLTRLRVGLAPDVRTDEEVRLRRVVDLPFARTFTARASLSSPPSGDDGSCRTGLITIDGDAVPMRTTAVGSSELVSCAPITLGAGRHALVGAGGDRSVVDRVVLHAGEPAGAVEPPPAAQVLDRTATSARVRVDAAVAPFWLVLGESDNDGWSAEVTSGDAQIGSRERVDGYANGWLVQPGADGTIEVELRWRPQRIVQLGYLVTFASIAVAAVLLWRSRRRRLEMEPPLAMQPRLARTWSSTLSWPARIALVAATVVATALVASWWIAAAVGVLTLVAVALGPLALPIALLGPVALMVCRLLGEPQLAWFALALVAAVAAWTIRQDGSNTVSADGS
jgi:hypothetical protein